MGVEREGEERRWEGLLLGGDVWQQISPALHPVGLPSRQTCCRCRPRWRPSIFYWSENWKSNSRKESVAVNEEETSL